MTKKCLRYNEGKPKLSYCLLGAASIIGEAKVWELGEGKYERANWLKCAPYTEVADSLLRHLTAFLNGEDLDAESGLPHADHVLTNARMLSQSFHTRKDLDDRGEIPVSQDESQECLKVREAWEDRVGKELGND